MEINTNDNWVIGVTSCYRRPETLTRTVKSLTEAGLKPCRVFADGDGVYYCNYNDTHIQTTKRSPQIGGWPNFYLALAELVNRHPQAEVYGIVQDDVVFCKGARKYLEQTYPRDAGIFSPFSPACYNKYGLGWVPVRSGYSMPTAQTIFFPAESAWLFLENSFVVNHRRHCPKTEHYVGDGLHHIDGVCGEFCRRTKKVPYFHGPSLAQHTGTSSVMYDKERRIGDKRMFANNFIGEGFDLDNPKVCAVMITGKDDSRKVLAEQAIKDFQDQTYENKILLIINDSGKAWFWDYVNSNSNITENVLPRLISREVLGELRNKGIRIAGELKADLVIQWDDDDRYRKDRIAYQVQQWKPGHCVMLMSQVRRDIVDNQRKDKIITWERGIEGTILHPITNSPVYPPDAKGEDTVFKKHWRNRTIVAENDPQMYIRQYHGNNTWDRQHIMGGK